MRDRQGGAAGEYVVRRLQFKRCAELDEAARLRLTVAGVIREHPQKRPDRWMRAGNLCVPGNGQIGGCEQGTPLRPRKRPDRWMRARDCLPDGRQLFLFPVFPSTSITAREHDKRILPGVFAFRGTRGRRQARFPRYLLFSKHSRKTARAVGALIALVAYSMLFQRKVLQLFPEGRTRRNTKRGTETRKRRYTPPGK